MSKDCPCLVPDVQLSRYTTIERLVNDESPDNAYRQSSYISITGGGRGSLPLFFATDARENRRQRAEFGKLIASTGMLGGRDWVVSMHSAGGLYRLVLHLNWLFRCGTWFRFLLSLPLTP